MILSFLVSLLALAAPVGTKDLASGFSNPPAEKCSHVIWGWEGAMDIGTIRHDLDSMKTKGFRSVIIEAGYHLPFEYLSEGWFETVRTAVLEAKARDLKVRIIDEGKYPSGFAGGKFTRERPELRMKALVVLDTIHVAKGEVLKGVEVVKPASSPLQKGGKTGEKEIFSAFAASRSGALDRPVPVVDGKIDFVAGNDSWDILLVGWDYRTGDTRAVNNPNGGKDKTNSQSDGLSAEAARQFIDWTHEKYKECLGDEFGKTMLGFRGDESDFGYLPWTPDFAEQFKAIKGYDPVPYIAGVLGRRPSSMQNLVRADYYDVWSSLFADNFFGQQAKWCEENGVEFITHLNKDHDMPECVRVSGSFFRDLSRIQVPGVDAIWNQIWPETVNDFPKFASSVAHVYGRERAFSESFAAYNIPPTIPTAEYALNYQMVRGINYFELMFWMAGSKKANWMTDPEMKPLNDWLNRVGWMMQQGTPGARIAVFYPTATLWSGDRAVNPDLVEISQILLGHQRDFDWVDDDAFSDALQVRGSSLQNRSGQRYSTLIIPSCDVITQKAWAVIEEFASKGGKVLFWGRRPSKLAGRSFREGIPVPELPGTVFFEPAVSWTPTVAASLPGAELSLGDGHKGITYTHRHLDGCDIYLIFNEGETPQTFEANFDAVGQVRQWDGRNGSSSVIDYETEDGRTIVNMTLKPWESRLLTIERCDSEFNVRKYGVRGRGKAETAAIQAVIDQAALSGGTVVFPAGQYLSGALFFPRGVNLRLEKGSVLKGTANPDDYPVIPTRFEGIDRNWRCAFLNFDNNDGVVVSGEGTVDGNGLEWNKIRAAGGRPRLICFTGCDGGSISGLKLRNQACWGLHVLYTRGFEIQGLDILAKDYIPSSDGIDIDSSSDVRIAGTFISVHDDCISIKSGKDEEGRRMAKPSSDILIEDCHFGYGHGAVTMGSEISGGIRGVVARRCRVDSDNWAPIRFKSQPPRGGLVQDILFEDISVSNVRNVFDVSLEWRSNAERDRVFVYADPVTRLKNVTVRRVSGDAQTMGHFYGFGCDPIARDVFRFEDCSFTAGKDLVVNNASIDLSGMKIIIK